MSALTPFDSRKRKKLDSHQENPGKRAEDRRKLVGLWLLAISAAGTLILALSLDPYPQPLSYHAFADNRRLLAIDNFWNVVSNLPLLVFGLSGLVFTLVGRLRGAQYSWRIFFAAIALAAIGSTWYHLAPDNDRLFIDRFPIGMLMGALFAALLAEHVGLKQERWLLPAVLIGAASALHWHYTDDLRLYVWFQVWTPIAVLTFLLLFKPLYGGRGWLLVAFALLILARVAEYFDVAIFRITNGFVGGHAIKHLLAGFAPLAIQIMLTRRGRTMP